MKKILSLIVATFLFVAFSHAKVNLVVNDVREQVGLWQSEVAGITASYNALAADYNAQMSKINYRFCNVGDLPRGATDPLPREFKPYQTK